MMKVIAEEHAKGSMDSEEKESVEGSVKEKKTDGGERERELKKEGMKKKEM